LECCADELADKLCPNAVPPDDPNVPVPPNALPPEDPKAPVPPNALPPEPNAPVLPKAPVPPNDPVPPKPPVAPAPLELPNAELFDPNALGELVFPNGELELAPKALVDPAPPNADAELPLAFTNGEVILVNVEAGAEPKPVELILPEELFSGLYGFGGSPVAFSASSTYLPAFLQSSVIYFSHIFCSCSLVSIDCSYCGIVPSARALYASKRASSCE
jgi:hypothetical protein